jgi:hypothetical protein
MFWKLLVLEFPLGIPETFLCSISDLPVKVFLPDALQLLMMFLRKFIYLEPKLFLLIVSFS